MDVDSFSTTRPMTQDAGSPTEIANLFDTIAYGKCKFYYHSFQFISLKDTVFLITFNQCKLNFQLELF